MRIRFNFSLTDDDISELKSQIKINKHKYNTIEPNNHIDFTFETKFLLEKEFDNWLEPWLDVGFVLMYDNTEELYLLTDINENI